MAYAVQRSCRIHGTDHNGTFRTVGKRRPGVNRRRSSSAFKRFLTVDGRPSNWAKGCVRTKFCGSRAMGKITYIYLPTRSGSIRTLGNLAAARNRCNRVLYYCTELNHEIIKLAN